MNKDILLWSNVEIMNVLDKWGVLTLRNLHKQLYTDMKLYGLRRRIHQLAQEDYVQISRHDLKNEMIVIPTKRTLDQLKSNRSSIDETMVYHNLFISQLGIELISRENVFYFNLPHEYQKSRTPLAFSPLSRSDYAGSAIGPDAYLGINHNEKIYKAAVEIEFTQKSSERIYEKFKQYKESSYFDYVIYFFKSKAVFNAYRKRLNEMVMEVSDEDDRRKLTGKIIFLYSPQKYLKGDILENSTMECQFKELSIDKFFGPCLTILDLNNKVKNQ